MPLVFSDRERLDATPSSGESMYAFLDRVAGPVWDRIRQLIEDWASDFSPDNRDQLVGRLKSRRGSAPVSWLSHRLDQGDRRIDLAQPNNQRSSSGDLAQAPTKPGGQGTPPHDCPPRTSARTREPAAARGRQLIFRAGCAW